MENTGVGGATGERGRTEPRHALGLMLRDELAALDEELGHLVSLMKVEGEALNSFDHMVEVAHVQVRITTSSLYI